MLEQAVEVQKLQIIFAGLPLNSPASAILHAMEHNDSLDLISGAMAGTSEFYAVVYGHHTGVYYKWDDVKLEILKFSNNRYKKFHEFREALEFMVRKGGDAEDSPDEERYWASVDPISDEMAASLTDTFINVKAQYEASSPSKPQTTGIPQKTTETPRTPYRPSTTFTSVNSAASSTMSSSPMSEMSFSFENLGFGDSVNKPTPFNRILSPPQITQPSASTTPPPVYRYERELHGIVRTHYDRVDREQVPILTLGYWVLCASRDKGFDDTYPMSLPTQTPDHGVQRLLSKNRKQIVSKTRTPWRYRTKRKTISRTPVEKALLKEKRLSHREAYKKALIAANEGAYAALRLKKKSHTITRWNAFLRKESQRINRGMFSSTSLVLELSYLIFVCSEIPDGEPRKQIDQLTREISAIWQAMTKEEQIAATDDYIVEISDQRETKALAKHNVPLNAFHDVRATLASVQRELEMLSERSGIEIVLLAARSNHEQFNQPFAFVSSQRVSDFFNLLFKTPVLDVVIRLEAYCISGVEGVVNNYQEELIALKKRTSALILEKLCQSSGNRKISRMSYTNFDTQITEKYSVVIKNWPLAKFCSPGDLGSRTELQVLFQAWESGATHFAKLSNNEMKAWSEARFRERMEVAGGAGHEDSEHHGIKNIGGEETNEGGGGEGVGGEGIGGEHGGEHGANSGANSEGNGGGNGGGNDHAVQDAGASVHSLTSSVKGKILVRLSPICQIQDLTKPCHHEPQLLTLHPDPSQRNEQPALGREQPRTNGPFTEFINVVSGADGASLKRPKENSETAQRQRCTTGTEDGTSQSAKCPPRQYQFMTDVALMSARASCWAVHDVIVVSGGRDITPTFCSTNGSTPGFHVI
ncbi:hypothetical protein A0H81_02985 [Grifola frondosa]|uniref:Ribonuclease H1 N-terminal domain-containing protein n=1 Tax=Grifola frondosa TaxID=5627 RepID=A0A1C7MJL0_GRIFR|nr:hypothetical protein A0H81_02985 [Grifola frondosa]